MRRAMDGSDSVQAYCFSRDRSLNRRPVLQMAAGSASRACTDEEAMRVCVAVLVCYA
jgi:hypothetical protein